MGPLFVLTRPDEECWGLDLPFVILYEKLANLLLFFVCDHDSDFPAKSGFSKPTL